MLQSLVVALVLSRFDYGSTVHFGLPQQLVDKLQSVQNAAARLIHAARRRDRISPLLQDLHWLRVADRITFRLAVLTYRCLHSSAPEYRVPVETTAASFRGSHTSTTSFFVVHCFGYFADLLRNHRR